MGNQPHKAQIVNLSKQLTNHKLHWHWCYLIIHGLRSKSINSSFTLSVGAFSFSGLRWLFNRWQTHGVSAFSFRVLATSLTTLRLCMSWRIDRWLWNRKFSVDSRFTLSVGVLLTTLWLCMTWRADRWLWNRNFSIDPRFTLSVGAFNFSVLQWLFNRCDGLARLSVACLLK